MHNNPCLPAGLHSSKELMTRWISWSGLVPNLAQPRNNFASSLQPEHLTDNRREQKRAWKAGETKKNENLFHLYFNDLPPPLPVVGRVESSRVGWRNSRSTFVWLLPMGVYYGFRQALCLTGRGWDHCKPKKKYGNRMGMRQNKKKKKKNVRTVPFC